MSVIRYLLDENMPHAIQHQLLRIEPKMDVLVMGASGAPPLGTSDPDILRYIEQVGRILVTRNRHTMPDHLRDHLHAGHHVPGIFVVTPGLSLGVVIRELHLIWGASEAEECRDLILYLPLSS